MLLLHARGPAAAFFVLFLFLFLPLAALSPGADLRYGRLSAAHICTSFVPASLCTHVPCDDLFTPLSVTRIPRHSYTPPRPFRPYTRRLAQVMASQLSRHEAVTYLWELLDAKKTYVRYIR